MINPNRATTSRDEESSAHMRQLLIELLVEPKPLQNAILTVSLIARLGGGRQGIFSRQTTSMPSRICVEEEYFMGDCMPTFSFVFDITFRLDVICPLTCYSFFCRSKMITSWISPSSAQIQGLL